VKEKLQEIEDALDRKPIDSTVWIRCTSEVTVTREPTEGDSWDRGNTSTTWYVGDVYKEDTKSNPLPKGDYHTLDVGYKIKPGTYYLVFAVYSTGDSFGHDEQSSIDFIDLFKTHDAAEECKSTLVAVKQGVFSVPLTTSCGNQIQYSVPWTGYFDSLDYIEIKTVTL
jgi:hypothetical protein